MYIHLGDTGKQQRHAISFPLDPVFSEAVKTSFSFLHESNLNAEKCIQTHSKLKHDPTDIEFGSFLVKLKCEASNDPFSGDVEEESHEGNISSLQSKYQMTKVHCVVYHSCKT